MKHFNVPKVVISLILKRVEHRHDFSMIWLFLVGIAYTLGYLETDVL